MQIRRQGAALLLILALYACTSTDNGSITGRIHPQGDDIRVTVFLHAKEIAADSPRDDGRFLLSVPPGHYDIRITMGSSPLPLSFPGVTVRSRESTDLGTISLALPTGNSVIRGRIKTSAAETRISLFMNGVERSSIHGAADGTYLFKDLAPAEYTLHVQSPGYLDETLTVTARDSETVKQDIRQIYLTSIEGADWTNGMLRSRGIGIPPPQAPTSTIRREMAKRAALADAERNMLRMLELVHVGPEQSLTDLLGSRNATVRLRGFLQGYRVSADRDLSDGRVEIELELPLNGPGGITSRLHAL